MNIKGNFANMITICIALVMSKYFLIDSLSFQPTFAE